MTNHETIIALNKIWYNLIGGDHHKDCDCHFRISTHYFYGHQVEYEVEHHGYILASEVDEYREFSTIYEAEKYLIEDVLKFGIIREIDYYLEHYGDLDYDQPPHHSKEDLEDIKKFVLAIVPD